jgi:hypothetical protein
VKFAIGEEREEEFTVVGESADFATSSCSGWRRSPSLA